MKLLVTILIALSALAVLVMAQVTGPSAIDYPNGPYQTSASTISGGALNWYGWNLGKKSALHRPMRIQVRLDSIGGTASRWRHIINYAGIVDTVYLRNQRTEAYWLPVGAENIPDSLFYIVPDSAGQSVGDMFELSCLKITAGQQYDFRLIFPTDTVKGTALTVSQPIWIGNGTAAGQFAYIPNDTVAVRYYAAYSNTYGGPYLANFSADTLADSTWTIDSTEAGTYNFIAVTGLDTMRWMQINRKGLTAADTVRVLGEIIYLRSN